ncbi:MAG: riboflavin biosynthesis protein RibF [Phycisphaerae bacterium]|nr:riboflavin biosynthesis protein RibF [Phycisphaerae bacterium]
MDVFNSLETFVPPPVGVVLTIGNFDGVHRGHARIIAAAREVAARFSAATVAMTFEPHPLAALAPERAPERLTTLKEKLALLERRGVSQCIVLPSEPALLALGAEDFLASLVAHCRPRALVEGPDFNFGRGRAGSIETLKQNAKRWGYDLHVVPAVHCEELPTRPTISSSSIRQALRDGRVAEANAMLERPYRIVGTTGGGAGRGAQLGFPTANLNGVVHLLPQEAVYAGVAQLAGGELHPAAVNVGPQPTFSQDQTCIEAHLLDFQGDMRGRRVGLHFLVRLRAQVRFSGVDELAVQLRRDVAATRGFSEQVEQIRQVEPLAL